MKNTVLLIALIITACGNPNQNKGIVEDVIVTPSKSETIWSGLTELFVEFPALVVNEPSKFAAHFTILNDHKPVVIGEVTVSLMKKDQVVVSSTVKSPSSPGIFGPTIVPMQTGNYQLVFDLITPTYSDRLVISDVIVYPTIESAADALEGLADASGITFLKEQAWKMEFETTQAGSKEIYNVIHTSGIWKVAPSDIETLIATSAGQVHFNRNNLTEGSMIKKGQILMSLQSSNLASDNLRAQYNKAKADYDQAEADHSRKQKLFESEIISKSAFEKVERDFQIAKANFETLSSDYEAGGKQIISKYDGSIKSLDVVNGSFVNQGTPLVTVQKGNSSLLEIELSPSYSSQLQDIRNVFYQSAADTWSDLNEKEGEILSVSQEVNMNNPLLTLFVKVNEYINMPEGAFSKVDVVVDPAIVGVVIPSSALLEDYGSYSVIVQISGERFELRNVKIGRLNGSEVEIVQGLESGEVVVSKGAFQVKMASMSGQAPAHGHAH